MRDLRGRALRLLIAFVLGTAGAIAIAVVLPVRYHFRGCMMGHDDVNVALVIAGSTGLTLACYAVLGAVVRRWPRATLLPRAVVVRS